MARAPAFLLTMTLLSGCMTGSDYTRPAIDAPGAFRYQAQEANDLANTAWWRQFGDPGLDRLIEEAVGANRDLRIAAARVEEFAARFASSRAELYPQIGYSAGASRDRSSERLGVPTAGVPNPRSTYQAALGASWEIDLWGRLHRLSEAARAELLATVEARQGVVLGLVAGVATGYLNLLELDKQLEITRQTVRTREEALALFELRFKGGVISKVELAQVRSEHEEALAAIPAIERAIAQGESALSLLIGRNPGPIARGRTLDQLTLFPVPSGLPSELLQRRPDIRQAEQSLVAANARIGAARALYYPTISLTGLFGVASADLDELFQGPARTWGFAGSLVGPIFSFGRIEGLVRQSEAQQRQLLAGYERAVQNGFREVEDALVDHVKSRERLAARGRQLDAISEYMKLSGVRYENGYTSYLEVLDAQRSAFNTELAYAQTQGDVLRALVATYKAMGGGWIVEADRLAQPRPASQASAAQGEAR